MRKRTDGYKWDLRNNDDDRSLELTMWGKLIKIDKTGRATTAGDILSFQLVLALQSLFSLTLHSHLPICGRGELSHHFC